MDSIDIDDDNDGILDVLEVCTFQQVSKTGVTATADATFNAGYTISTLVDGTDNTYQYYNAAVAIANKEVIEVRGYWGTNYDLHPWMRIAPAFGYLGLFSTWIYMIMDNIKMAFIANSIAIAGIVGTAGVSIYPFLLPSSTHLSSGLTVWDAPSSSWFLMVIASCVVLAMPMWIKKVMKFFALGWTEVND